MRRLILAVVLLLVGCAAPIEQAAPATSEATGSGVPSGLAWSADLVEGGQLDGGDLAGGDVVLWFWAPW